MELKKISAYTVYANPMSSYYWVRVRLDDHDPEVIDIKCNSLSEITSLVDLLRNEANTLFDIATNNIVIGWEPTGENNPVPAKK